MRPRLSCAQNGAQPNQATADPSRHVGMAVCRTLLEDLLEVLLSTVRLTSNLRSQRHDFQNAQDVVEINQAIADVSSHIGFVQDTVGPGAQAHQGGV